MARTRKQLWRYTRALAAPVLLWGLVVFALKEPVQVWLQGDARYDEEAVREWIKEARIQRTLPEMAADYLAQLERYRGSTDDSRLDGSCATEQILNGPISRA